LESKPEERISPLYLIPQDTPAYLPPAYPFNICPKQQYPVSQVLIRFLILDGTAKNRVNQNIDSQAIKSRFCNDKDSSAMNCERMMLRFQDRRY